MNKEDIKLLKKAANAAGLEVIGYSAKTGLRVRAKGSETAYKWNPLKNLGDALWLAITLEMDLDLSVAMQPDADVAAAVYYYEHTVSIDCEGDPYSATCRAIVMVAASKVSEKDD